MDALTHYHRAEELLAQATEDDGTPAFAAEDRTRAWVHNTLMAGIGHALLALTGVTMLNDARQGADGPDYDAWYNIASVNAPIPPETDDDPAEDEPEDVGLHVGDVSPTDPDELGPWLRGLPFGTILRDVNGDASQISSGFETVYQAPDREFPALLDLSSGRPMELTKGTNDILGLADNCAPFVVLAIGTRDRE